MSLDINTPKGQETLRQEEEQLLLLSKAYPSLKFVNTPKDKHSDVDGFVIRDGTAVAMFLSSCRQMTKKMLFSEYGGEFILTFDKIVKASALAKSLCMPVAGYVYLVPEKKVIVTRLIDEHGQLLPNVRICRTETQATCNGGKAVRANAYIKV